MSKLNLPKVFFGKVGNKPKKWREEVIEDVEDDEELKETPPDVLKMLGFDPKELAAIKSK